jgi:hypothetical protein
MDQEAAQSSQGETFPIFDAYRRGYDPEQVDRYISEQQRRLDDAQQRASEAERKLAAAVGQLRELHRRVAALESEERSQGPSLDMLGERVQRILQESWEGAYALRQSAEAEVGQERERADREVTALREAARDEVAALREAAQREVAELIDAAQRRAALMRAETERRRQAYLERVEEDRARAVNQITYLYDQRQLALGELSRLQASIESTVGEMAKSPLGVPSVMPKSGMRPRTIEEMVEDEAPSEPGPGSLSASLGRRERPRPVMRFDATDDPVSGPPSAPAPGPAPQSAGRMPGLERPISGYDRGEPAGSPPPVIAPPSGRHRRIEVDHELSADPPLPAIAPGLGSEPDDEDTTFVLSQPVPPMTRAERRAAARAARVFDFDDQ